MRKPNEYILKDDYAILRITSKTHGIVDCKIDLDKVDDLKQYNWHLKYRRNSRCFCVARQVVVSKNPRRQATLLLHQHLFSNDYQTTMNMTCDHINRDPLDNRLLNLRMATNSEQVINRRLQCNNSSGFRGVSFDKRGEFFRVKIAVDNHKIYLGSFKVKEEAASAYNHAAKILHGANAQLNPVGFKLSNNQKKVIDTRISKIRGSLT